MDVLRANPGGLTHAGICSTLRRQSTFSGTHRNLIFMAAAILRALLNEGKIKSCTRSGIAVFHMIERCG